MFQAPKPFRKEVVVDEPSKDDATTMSNFFSCYKKYQHKEPFKHLVIPSMTIEEFWKDGDKDYNKFEYGKQLVQATAKSKLQLMDKELMTIPSRICHFLMREYISPRGVFHTPDGQMAQFSMLCDYIH
jgi:hypothetical protein